MSTHFALGHLSGQHAAKQPLQHPWKGSYSICLELDLEHLSLGSPVRHPCTAITLESRFRRPVLSWRWISLWRHLLATQRRMTRSGEDAPILTGDVMQANLRDNSLGYANILQKRMVNRDKGLNLKAICFPLCSPWTTPTCLVHLSQVCSCPQT